MRLTFVPCFCYTLANNRVFYAYSRGILLLHIRYLSPLPILFVSFAHCLGKIDLLQTHRYRNPAVCAPVVACECRCGMSHIDVLNTAVCLREAGEAYGLNEFILRCFIEIIGVEFPYFIEKTLTKYWRPSEGS